MGFSCAAPVQAAVIPIFPHRDVVVQAVTGSGKTLAYLIPISEFLHRMRDKLPPAPAVLALIVVPTRELAIQVYRIARSLLAATSSP